MMEAYRPTPAQRENIQMSPDLLKVSGDGAFFTLQGEGQSIGKPAVFLRLQFCNLHCGWCDTKYTWDKTSKEFWTEGEDWSMERTREEIAQYPTNRLVITGGEPLLQQKKIAELIAPLPSMEVEIETNGTILPIKELADKCQFNVSPKLENSDNSHKLRYKPDVLRAFNALERTTFKFVVQEESDLEEVDAIIADCELDPSKIIIMPEGTTQEEVTQHGRNIAEQVKKRGWRLLPRMHVMLWGTERKL